MSSYSRAGYSRQMRPHDVFGAVRDVVALVLPATGRAVRGEMDLVGDGVVECVPEELNQVGSNLVQNAIEASPDVNGLVRGRGGRDGDGLVGRPKGHRPGWRAD